jgi:hypothetical protein
MWLSLRQTQRLSPRGAMQSVPYASFPESRTAGIVPAGLRFVARPTVLGEHPDNYFRAGHGPALAGMVPRFRRGRFWGGAGCGGGGHISNLLKSGKI